MKRLYTFYLLAFLMPMVACAAEKMPDKEKTSIAAQMDALRSNWWQCGCKAVVNFGDEKIWAEYTQKFGAYEKYAQQHQHCVPQKYAIYKESAAVFRTQNDLREKLKAEAQQAQVHAARVALCKAKEETLNAIMAQHAVQLANFVGAQNALREQKRLAELAGDDAKCARIDAEFTALNALMWRTDDIEQPQE